MHHLHQNTAEDNKQAVRSMLWEQEAFSCHIIMVVRQTMTTLLSRAVREGKRES